MKKFSIATALASLLAVSSLSVGSLALAADVTVTKVEKQQNSTVKNVVKKNTDAKKDVKDAHKTAASSKHADSKAHGEVKEGCETHLAGAHAHDKHVHTTHAGHVKHAHDVNMNSELRRGPRIKVGGEVHSYAFKVMDKEEYNVVPGGIHGKNEELQNIGLQEEGKNFGDYSKTWGMETDALISLRAENTTPALGGMTYGAEAQLGIPVIKTVNLSTGRAAMNRGVKLFTQTSYGNFSVGYQPGVESKMKIVASSLDAGNGIEGTWHRHVNLEGNNGLGMFHLSPKLYSESMSSHDNILSYGLYNKYNKDMVNTLPFRLSYYSPNFAGFRFGVSYSPSYNSELYTIHNPATVAGTTGGKVIIDKIKLKGDMTISEAKFSSLEANNVENLHGTIVNADLALTNNRLPKAEVEKINVAVKDSGHAMLSGNSKLTNLIIPKDTEFTLSTNTFPVKGGEKIGKDTPASTYYIGPDYENIISAGVSYEGDFNEFKVKASVVGEFAKARSESDVKRTYDKYTKMNDLAAANIGVAVGWRDLEVVASYANLGKSGVLHQLYHYDEANRTMQEDKKSQAAALEHNTYFWTAGAAYKYEGAKLSATYFQSNVNDGNKFHDFAIGLNYDLGLSSRGQFTPYVTYHYFTTEQKPSQKAAPSANSPVEDNKGSVLLAGVKFNF